MSYLKKSSQPGKQRRDLLNNENDTAKSCRLVVVENIGPVGPVVCIVK